MKLFIIALLAAISYAQTDGTTDHPDTTGADTTGADATADTTGTDTTADTTGTDTTEEPPITTEEPRSTEANKNYLFKMQVLPRLGSTVCIEINMPKGGLPNCDIAGTVLKGSRGFSDGLCSAAYPLCTADVSAIHAAYASLGDSCPDYEMTVFCPPGQTTRAISTTVVTEEPTEEPTEESTTAAEEEPIKAKLATKLTLTGITDCAAAIPGLKKAIKRVVNIVESRIKVTAGTGCGNSRRRRLDETKTFDVELEGSEAQITSAETTLKANDFITKLNQKIAEVIADSDNSSSHPLAGASATTVSEPVKTDLGTTAAPEDDSSSGMSAGIIVVIVIAVLVVIGGIVFFVMNQSQDDGKAGDVETELTKGNNTTE